MSGSDRIPRWLDELEATLGRAAKIAARGRDEFNRDEVIPFAFEALSNRVGDLVKRLVSADAQRFSDPIWRQAARHRDYAVHLCDRLDEDLLWRTVSESFPMLTKAVQRQREHD